MHAPWCLVNKHGQQSTCKYRGTGNKWEALEATADLSYQCLENREVLGRNDAVALVAKCIERVGGNAVDGTHEE